jgi:nucleoside-diphosphate-sugar epimerase
VKCALQRGTGGRAYFVNDQDAANFRDFVGMIAGLQGLSITTLRSMPYGLAFILGRLMEIYAALTFQKSDPPLTRSLVRMIGREFTTNDAAARNELGYIGKISRADGLRRYSS